MHKVLEKINEFKFSDVRSIPQNQFHPYKLATNHPKINKKNSIQKRIIKHQKCLIPTNELPNLYFENFQTLLKNTKDFNEKTSHFHGLEYSQN